MIWEVGLLSLVAAPSGLTTEERNPVGSQLRKLKALHLTVSNFRPNLRGIRVHRYT